MASDPTMAGASGSEQAGAREPTPTPTPAGPRALLDLQLLMAALRGDSKLLRGMLQFTEEEDANAVRNGDLLLHVLDSEIEVDDDGGRTPPPSSSQDDDAPPPPPAPLFDELDGVTIQGDSLLHVVAACGDTQEHLDCAKIIVRDKKRTGGAAAARLALEARNRNGDTPLHCAAGAGNADMIGRLVDLVADTADDNEASEAAKRAFLRIRNECGETALHQAIRAANKKNKVACIDCLMAVDSDLACIPHGDEEGASPLYLAISMGEVKIARHLYSKSEGKLSYSGPDGSNVLHVAVSRGQAAALPMVLKWLSAAPDLRWQLTRQRDKENGSTPLHLAAAACPVLKARMLLDANVSTAYRPDKRGRYPIHAAAGAGSLHVVKILLERCPECTALRDANGRTFLHVAVEEGCYRVVKYVCHEVTGCRQRHEVTVGLLLSSILNAQDINGDTALHRAVHAANLTIVNYLVRNQRVRLDVTNKVGMTPIDLTWCKMPLPVYYAWDPKIRIRKYLSSVGAPYCQNRIDLFNQIHILPKVEEDKMSENLTAAAQVLCIFSALITTVTFASVFTLPGGYRTAGDAVAIGGVAGTPVLAGWRSYAFNAFVLSDAVAFICSLYATSVLLYAGMPYGTINTRFSSINIAYTLMWHAGRSLLAAFALGLFVVLRPVALTIAIVVAILMFIGICGFIKDSEGLIDFTTVLGRSHRMGSSSAWGIIMLAFILYLLDRFWTYVIIFGVPAFHRW